MKKFINFTINNRYIVLGVFILFTAVSIFFSNKVNINDEMTKYLPNTSETKIGMNIMEEQFSNIENSSSFNLMFKGLNEEEKQKICEELKNIKNVSSVTYDNTEDYNKDDYTLYLINVDDKADSKTASKVYDEIMEKYKSYEIYTNGDIALDNTDILPLWIPVTAISCAVVILIIMCESYVEPFLFLVAIFMAVILNSGTNIIFNSVSNITNSISAILQMALSMDYSIMLMNRFRQEKQKEKDKVKAMKNALYNAFKSISSSSITTIVGLITLVFMSFTIGADLGLVLAKGVLFSLITIFFVLPTLILIFDKLITKTKKKSFNFKLNKLGNLSHKLRYPLNILFVLIFVGSYFLKGNLQISYTFSQVDEISKVFGKSNQIAVVYKNENEEKIGKLLNELEQNNKIKSVLGYSNTINEKLPYNELNKKLQDFNSDVNIDDYLLKIIYYKYYNKEENNKMTFEQLIDFIESNYNNENINDMINSDIKNNINKLKYFVKKDLINKSLTKDEISNILGIDKESVNDILVYYNSKNNNLKLTIPEFIKFINNDVLTNKKYSSSIDEKTLSNLKNIEKFTNKTLIQTKMTSSELSNLFGIDKSLIDSLFTYYISINNIDEKLTLYDFSKFVLENIVTDETYSSTLDSNVVENIKMLNTFSNKDIITKDMTSKELYNLFGSFGINEDAVNNILMLYYSNTPNFDRNDFMTNNDNYKMSPINFISIVIKNSENADTLKLYNIMTSGVNETSYDYKQLSNFIGMDENNIKNIYILYVSKNTSLKLTPIEFINLILDNKDNEMLSKNLDKNIISNLTLLKTIMNSTLNNTKYSSDNLSSLFNIDKNNIALLYGLYTSTYTYPNQTISLKTFVEFMLNDVLNNNTYSKSIDEKSKSSLKTVHNIMISSLNNTKYTKEEMYSTLHSFTDKLDKNTIELLYMYYGSQNNYDEKWTLTIEQMIKFLNTDILNDSRFTSFIDDDIKNKIIESEKTIDDSKNLLVGKEYSRIVINTEFDNEGEETFNFIKDLKDKLKDYENSYVIGDSAMAYEMNKTFEQEFNFISILTMLAIFVVVALTFKSLIIPLILVLLIQCAVYTTMGFLSLLGGTVYFIAILIVQSILMGATIDYAIVYTSYYLESRKSLDLKEAIINAYNKSIHTILTSASILTIVTFIVGIFSSNITSKICITLCVGTICSTILILFLLPSVLAVFDRIISKHK